MSVFFQPPPAITDKQLDEREHTVEEWKGRNHPLFLRSSLISCHKYLAFCSVLHKVGLCSCFAACGTFNLLARTDIHVSLCTGFIRHEFIVYTDAHVAYVSSWFPVSLPEMCTLLLSCKIHISTIKWYFHRHSQDCLAVMK